MRLHFSICTFLLVVSSSGFYAASERELDTQQLELLQKIRQLHTKQENIGFSFVMTHSNKVVLRDFAGQANVAYDQAISADSRFSIMSITKGITGLIAEQLASEKKLDLLAPISTYLPDYKGDGADTITLQMLLNHSSGIPHVGHPQRKALYVEHFECAQDSLYLIEEKSLIHKPGEKYTYSSSGYNLLAGIIEKVEGKCISDIAQERLFSPLHLFNTDYMDVLDPRQKIVNNYSYVDIWNYQASEELQYVPKWDFSYNMGGGNMYSTVDDLAAIGNYILDKMQANESFADTISKPLNSEVSRWSAGFITNTNSEFETVYITGATPGVQASLYIYPEYNLVFAMLANSWGKGSAGGALVIDAPQQAAHLYIKNVILKK